MRKGHVEIKPTNEFGFARAYWTSVPRDEYNNLRSDAILIGAAVKDEGQDTLQEELVAELVYQYDMWMRRNI